ncbi:hypothetical protein SUGI_0459290 [Cryptomeria japonica]|uniref:auxin-responsive protein SAUR24 n=1 Tax=Cryptomeria japonica TaxID=3369 RepID=UPI002408AFAE|nr:auxin-responsive protein SAUR24 [Cryptomeria japonica]GLJ24081.1 hypothetical protein SUGI_0459290 [Cryptomeria japonica]
MARRKGNPQVIQVKPIMRAVSRFVNAHKTVGYGLSRRRRRYFTSEDMFMGRSCGALPSDVPKGHCAVYVGSERSRFIIPAVYLNHSLFRALLDKAEEEYGFDHQMGLIIPCEEAVFQYLTSMLSKKDLGLNNIKLDELLDIPSVPQVL